MNDKAILRNLAARYAAAAANPANQERLRLHRAANDLKPIRPVVSIFEEPWNELADADDFLRERCADPYLQGVERFFRRALYRWNHYPVDMALLPHFPVGKVVVRGGIGIEVDEKIVAIDAGNHIVSHEYHDQLQTMGDLNRLHAPAIAYNEAETRRRFNLVGDIFGDILPVLICGAPLHVAMWDDMARYRGVTALLASLVEDPDFSHACVAKLTDIYLETLAAYERLNLLGPDPLYVHCTPATASALPAPDFDGEHYRPRDIWGRGMAQIFASVSPAMHDEFDIQYMKKALAPFGLNYYGCCEPLDRKMDIVEQIPNLRKVGCTPWADVDRMAERVGKKYVLSCKPNPAHVASFDEGVVRAELRRTVAAIGRNGCAADITLKDISTVGRNPDNLARWAKIAMEEAGA